MIYSNMFAVLSSTDSNNGVFWFGFAIAFIMVAIPLVIAFNKGVIQTTVFRYFGDLSQQVINVANANARNRRVIDNFMADTRQTRDVLTAFRARTSKKDRIVHAIKSTVGYEIDDAVAEMEALAKEIADSAEAIKYTFFSAISEVNRGAATKEVYEYLNSKPKTAKVEVDYGVNSQTGSTNNQSSQQSPVYDTFYDENAMNNAGIDGVMYRKNYQYIIRYKGSSTDVQVSGEQINLMQNQGKKVGIDFTLPRRVM